MSAKAVSVTPSLPTHQNASWSLTDRRVIRYAFGATVAMAIAMGFGWTLSFIVPVLTLSLLQTPGTSLNVKSGLAFIVIIGVACWLGWQLGNHGIPYPALYIPLVGIVLFRIFYAGHLGKPFPLVMMLLIAISIIPLVRLINPSLAIFVAKGIFFDAVVAVIIGVVAYAIIPEPVTKNADGDAGSPSVAYDQAFRNALVSTVVVLPLLMVFYFFRLTGAIVILVFVGLLSSRPALATNPVVGKALLAGNVLGGIISIVFYELLVMVPLYYFMLLMTLLIGLVLGTQVFSGKPTARVFGLAFSTTLLIIGSTTTSTDEAGGAVYTRVIQIAIAVFYVVTAFRLWERAIPHRR